MKSIKMKPNGYTSPSDTEKLIELLNNNILWQDNELYQTKHSCLSIGLDLNRDNSKLLKALKTNTSIKELSFQFNNLQNNTASIYEVADSLSNKNIEYLSFIDQTLNTVFMIELFQNIKSTTIKELNLNYTNINQNRFLDLLDQLKDKCVKKLSITASFIDLDLIEDQDALTEKFNDLQLEAISLSSLNIHAAWNAISKMENKTYLNTIGIDPRYIELFKDFPNIKNLYLFFDHEDITPNTVRILKIGLQNALFEKPEGKGIFIDLFSRSKDDNPKNIKKLTIVQEDKLLWGINTISSFLNKTNSLKEFSLITKKINQKDWLQLKNALTTNDTIKYLDLSELKLTAPMTNNITSLLLKEDSCLTDLEISASTYNTCNHQELLSMLHAINAKSYFNFSMAFLRVDENDGANIDTAVELLNTAIDKLITNEFITINIGAIITNKAEVPRPIFLKHEELSELNKQNLATRSPATKTLLKYIEDFQYSGFISCETLMESEKILKVKASEIHDKLINSSIFLSFGNMLKIVDLVNNKTYFKTYSKDTEAVVKFTIPESIMQLLCSFIEPNDLLNLAKSSLDEYKNKNYVEPNDVLNLAKSSLDEYKNENYVEQEEVQSDHSELSGQCGYSCTIF